MAISANTLTKRIQKDTNGNVTTNTTGILSPYGSFFATEPGPAALVTMPDVDTGARGTGTVYCVSVESQQESQRRHGFVFQWAGCHVAKFPLCLLLRITIMTGGHNDPG